VEKRKQKEKHKAIPELLSQLAIPIQNQQILD